MLLFVDIHERLREELKSGRNNNGTTLTVVIKHEQGLTVAAVGDSMAHACRSNQALTIRHSVLNFEEYQRMRTKGARFVYALGPSIEKDMIDVYEKIEQGIVRRVPMDPAHVCNVAGEVGTYVLFPQNSGIGALAVTRALGDFDAEVFGVTPLPDVIHLRHSQPELIVVASDGVWDVISSEELGRLAMSIPVPSQKEVSNLLQTCFVRAKKFFENDTDDCTLALMWT